MKALVCHGPGSLQHEDSDDPQLEAPGDVILRVTATAISPADLHIYNEVEQQTAPLIMGHEFVGIVQAVGKGVGRLAVGDRVFVPFPVACGTCWFCSHELPGHCDRADPDGVFGVAGLAGGHAEYARVPFADAGPRVVPDGLSDEGALFLTDIAPAGWAAIDWGAPRGGEHVVVVGAGPTGLAAMKSARLRGAGRVIAIDKEAWRLKHAVAIGAADDVLFAGLDDLEGAVRDITGGRGGDIVVDAVAAEAGRRSRRGNVVHLQMGSIQALRTCMDVVRPGGTISVVGHQPLPYENFPLKKVIDKGVNLRMGQPPVHHYLDALIDHVVAGRLVFDDVITHRLPLSEGARGFALCTDNDEHCVKVMLQP
jgi:threonine dehydrogenase-like Zn-dependent dehydrogenase